MNAGDAARVLCGQGRDDGGPKDAERGKAFEVGLDTAPPDRSSRRWWAIGIVMNKSAEISDRQRASVYPTRCYSKFAPGP
jgi:hypothetical protein